MTATANGLLSKLTTIFLTLLFIFLSATAVLAQDATTSGTTGKTNLRDRKETRVETRKANVQERLTALKERIATKEAALKARLQNFKDQKKAQIAERVNVNLANINEKVTGAMNIHLGVMSGILDKLEARVNAGTKDIKDPAAVRSAIADARGAISSANEAVALQADKDYVLEATSEATVRKDMQGVKEKLRTDLGQLRKLVIDAKQKVANAIRVAKSNEGDVSNGQ
ncbi:hypothetical protein HYS96_03470 [Candidatus Daviesbacteria bacterium]|nr:hypothetical protein [Candidatus Daviesbacteria bacterium]